MPDSIEIDTLKKYLNNELPASEKRQLEKFMMQHPHYFKILKGLSQLRSEFGEDEARIEKYLKENLNNLASRLFKKK